MEPYNLERKDFVPIKGMIRYIQRCNSYQIALARETRGGKSNLEAVVRGIRGELLGTAILYGFNLALQGIPIAAMYLAMQ